MIDSHTQSSQQWPGQGQTPNVDGQVNTWISQGINHTYENNNQISQYPYPPISQIFPSQPPSDVSSTQFYDPYQQFSSPPILENPYTSQPLSTTFQPISSSSFSSTPPLISNSYPLTPLHSISSATPSQDSFSSNILFHHSTQSNNNDSNHHNHNDHNNDHNNDNNNPYISNPVHHRRNNNNNNDDRPSGRRSSRDVNYDQTKEFEEVMRRQGNNSSRSGRRSPPRTSRREDRQRQRDGWRESDFPLKREPNEWRSTEVADLPKFGLGASDTLPVKQEVSSSTTSTTPVVKQSENGRKSIFTPVSFTKSDSLTQRELDSVTMIVPIRPEDRHTRWTNNNDQVGRGRGRGGHGPVRLESQLKNYGRGLLMVKNMGWNEGKGLGRNETGLANPVDVRMKNDRMGLGVINESSRRAVGENPKSRKTPAMRASEHRRRERIKTERRLGLAPGTLIIPDMLPKDGGPKGSGKKRKAIRKRERREDRLGLERGALKNAHDLTPKHLRKLLHGEPGSNYEGGGGGGELPLPGSEIPFSYRGGGGGGGERDRGREWGRS